MRIYKLNNLIYKNYRELFLGRELTVKFSDMDSVYLYLSKTNFVKVPLFEINILKHFINTNIDIYHEINEDPVLHGRHNSRYYEPNTGHVIGDIEFLFIMTYEYYRLSFSLELEIMDHYNRKKIRLPGNTIFKLQKFLNSI